MNIKLNGKVKTVPEDISLDELINGLKLGNRKVVVVLNEKIEKKNPKLEDGDRVEIITFVGGG